MGIDELKERLAAIDEELKDIVEQLDADPEEDAPEDEERSSTDELEERSNKLMDERASIVAEIEKAEAAIAEEKRAMEDVISNKQTIEIEKREDTKMTDIEIRNSEAYVNAYAEYLKSGDEAECRALLSENGSGTVAVPELVYDIVKTAWEREGIISRVRKAYLKGNIKVGFEISATAAATHNEGVAVDEETLVLGTVEITPQSIKKWISISDEAMDLRGEAFIRYIYDELTYQIAKKAADLLVGMIKAAGTVSTSTAVGVPAITVTSISMDTIAQAVAQLSDEAANPVVMMNKLTWAEFKKVQYANGYGADPFEGLPVEFNNTITAFSAATTGVPYVLVGDLEQGALANFPNGEDITFKFDENTLATQDLVRIIGREYVGLGIVAPNAFVKVTK